MKLRTALDFELPRSRVADKPAELRGAGRDDVQLMVAGRSTGSIAHAVFDHLDRYLLPGDVLVVNTSATIPASVGGHLDDDTSVRVHFSSPASGGLWAVEIRGIDTGGGTKPGPGISPQSIRLPGGARLHLLARSPRTPRLWIAATDGIDDLEDYLYAYGEPIRYGPGPELGLDYYQTVFALHPGSAEMPSAGRPFTTSMVTRLVSRGVVVVPIVLHSGVSSYEEGETPGEERYAVSDPTAAVINAMRNRGGRVVAVGTTVVRAVETVADSRGVVHPGAGTTDLLLGPDRAPRAIDGLLTGWHEPRSSHLLLLEAFLGRESLAAIYEAGIVAGYQWHEFGDELLIL